MSRKRMNLLIALGMAVVFAISSAVTFSACKNTVTTEFRYNAQRSETEIYDYVRSYLSSEDADISTPQELVNELFTYASSYPSAVAVFSYSENSELLAINRSFLRSEKFKPALPDGELDLEDYLTDEMKNDIAALIKNASVNHIMVRSLSYALKDGKIIPVDMELEVHFDFKVRNLTLHLSNETPAQIISDFENFELYFSDIYPNAFENKTVNRIRQQIVSSSIGDVEKYYREKVKDSGGSYFGSDELEGHEIFTYSFYKDDKPYYLAFIMKDNSICSTFISHNFKSQIGILAFWFSIMAAFVFAFANKLYSKNKRINTAKQAFISAAAHELKTPLTIIQNQSEFIIENVAPEKNGEYIKSVYAESQRMDKLVKDLLQYNRLASSDKIEKEMCSLTKIVTQETEKYTLLAKQKEVVVKTEIAEDVTINANADFIALVIDNYLSNAIKHTQQGKSAYVTLTDKRFSVFNEGELIPETDKSEIFEVFTKTDKSRQNDGSSGMGLAICKQILELHKYKYGFKNENNGVTFYFEF